MHTSTIPTKTRPLRGLAIASLLAAALPAAAEAKSAMVVAALSPLPGETAHAIVQSDAAGTQGVVTGLPAGVRYSMAASTAPCDQPARRARSIWRGLTDATGGAAVRFTRKPRGARSVRLFSAGEERACGDTHRVRRSPRPDFLSFTLHPVEGHEARGIIRMTRLGVSIWKVHGVLTGVAADASLALTVSMRPCTTSLVDSEGWDEVPLGVVDSEGWDEVPEDLLFRVVGTAGGAVIGGALALQPGSIGSLGLSSPTAPVVACSLAK